MPALELSEQQVFDLVEQLPRDRQVVLMRNLLVRQWPEWHVLNRLGEHRIRAVAAERGHDWDAMSELEREAFVDDLVHEDRACTRS